MVTIGRVGLRIYPDTSKFGEDTRIGIKKEVKKLKVEIPVVPDSKLFLSQLKTHVTAINDRIAVSRGYYAVRVPVVFDEREAYNGFDRVMSKVQRVADMDPVVVNRTVVFADQVREVKKKAERAYERLAAGAAMPVKRPEIKIDWAFDLGLAKATEQQKALDARTQEIIDNLLAQDKLSQKGREAAFNRAREFNKAFSYEFKRLLAGKESAKTFKLKPIKFSPTLTTSTFSMNNVIWDKAIKSLEAGEIKYGEKAKASIKRSVKRTIEDIEAEAEKQKLHRRARIAASEIMETRIERFGKKLASAIRNVDTHISLKLAKPNEVVDATRIQLARARLSAKVAVEAAQDSIARTKLSIKRAFDSVKAEVKPILDRTGVTKAAVTLRALGKTIKTKVRAILDSKAYAAAKAKLAALNKAGAKSVGQWAARLSGARMMTNLVDKLIGPFRELDKMIPSIIALGPAIGAAGGLIMNAGFALLSLGRSIGQILPAALALPTVFMGIAVGALAFGVGIADINNRLPKIGKAFEGLKKSMQDDFWSVALKPMDYAFHTLFPSIQRGMRAVAYTSGELTATFAHNFAQQLPASLDIFFKATARMNRILTGSAAPITAILGVFLRMADWVLPRFAQGVNNIVTGWADWLTEAEKSGKLQFLIERGVERFKQLWSVLKNIGGVLDALTRPLEKLGFMSLGSLAADLERMKNSLNSYGGQNWIDTTARGVIGMRKNIGAEMGKGFDEFWSKVPQLISYGLPKIGSAFGIIAGGVFGGLADAMPGIARFTTLLLEAVKILEPSIRPFVAQLGTAAELIGEMAVAFAPLIGFIMDITVQAVGPLIDVVKVLSVHLMNAMNVLRPVIQYLIDVASAHLPRVADVIGKVFNVVVNAVAPVLEAVVGFADVALPTLANAFEGLLPVITPILNATGAFAKMLIQVATVGFAILVPALTFIVQIVSIVARTLLRFLSSTSEAITKLLNRDFSGAKDAAKDAIGAFTDGFGDLKEKGAEYSKNFWDGWNKANANIEKQGGMVTMGDVLNAQIGKDVPKMRVAGVTAGTTVTAGIVSGVADSKAPVSRALTQATTEAVAEVQRKSVGPARRTGAHLGDNYTQGFTDTVIELKTVAKNETAKAIDQVMTKDAEFYRVGQHLGGRQAQGYDDAITSTATEPLARVIMNEVNQPEKYHKYGHSMGSAVAQGYLDGVKTDQAVYDALPRILNGSKGATAAAARTIGNEAAQGYLDGVESTISIKAKPIEELLFGPRGSTRTDQVKIQGQHMGGAWAQGYYDQIKSSGDPLAFVPPPSTFDTVAKKFEEMGTKSSGGFTVGVNAGTAASKPGLIMAGTNVVGALAGPLASLFGIGSSGGKDMGAGLGDGVTKAAPGARAAADRLGDGVVNSLDDAKRDSEYSGGRLAAQMTFIMSATASAVIGSLGLVRNALGVIPAIITSAIPNPGGLLYGAGALIMSGLISGINSRRGALSATLASITRQIPDEKGPYSKDRVLLKPAGELIMMSLVDGFKEGAKEVYRYLNSFTNEVARTEFMAPTASLSANRSVMSALNDPMGTGAGTAPMSIAITNNYPQAEPTSRTVNRAMQLASIL